MAIDRLQAPVLGWQGYSLPSVGTNYFHCINSPRPLGEGKIPKLRAGKEQMLLCPSDRYSLSRKYGSTNFKRLILKFECSAILHHSALYMIRNSIGNISFNF
jgi:hypothetical protein